MEDFYKHNKPLMMLFLQRKGLSKEDAEEVIQDAFLYYTGYPHQFDERFVYLKLNQLRINLMDKQSRYNKLKREWRKENYVELTQDDFDTIVSEEVFNVVNEKHQDILVKHILEGLKPEEITDYSDVLVRQVTFQFKKRMIEKYGMGI